MGFVGRLRIAKLLLRALTLSSSVCALLLASGLPNDNSEIVSDRPTIPLPRARRDLRIKLWISHFADFSLNRELVDVASSSAPPLVVVFESEVWYAVIAKASL